MYLQFVAGQCYHQCFVCISVPGRVRRVSFLPFWGEVDPPCPPLALLGVTTSQTVPCHCVQWFFLAWWLQLFLDITCHCVQWLHFVRAGGIPGIQLAWIDGIQTVDEESLQMELLVIQSFQQLGRMISEWRVHSFSQDDSSHRHHLVKKSCARDFR